MNAIDRGSKHLVPFGGGGDDEHPLAPGNEDFGYREPPHNTEAEQALLGALLMQNEGVASVREVVEPQHFFEPVHGKIYANILAVVDRGQRASPVTLKPYFENDPALSEVGGASYLVRLAGSAVSSQVDDYARAILDCWRRRKLIVIGEEIVRAAYDATVDDPPAAQVELAQECLFEVLGDRQDAGGFKSRADIMRVALLRADAAQKRGSIIGVETGLAGLDNILGGLEDGQLIYLGARPKVGKSALAKFIGENVARRYDRAVGVFSIEMDDNQNGQRALSTDSGIGVDRIRKGRLGQDEWVRLIEVAAQDRLPFFIDCCHSLTVAQLRSRALAFRRKRPDLCLLIVDYLGLVKPDDRYRGQRVNEVSAISAALKRLALEMSLPLLVLSQFSREAAKREDPRPKLSDFRDSGALEQDGDVLLAMHRRHAIEPDPPEGDDARADWESDRDNCEVYVLAQRQGPTGRVPLRIEAATGRFFDRSTAAEQPGLSDRWERIP